MHCFACYQCLVRVSTSERLRGCFINISIVTNVRRAVPPGERTRPHAPFCALCFVLSMEGSRCRDHNGSRFGSGRYRWDEPYLFGILSTSPREPGAVLGGGGGGGGGGERRRRRRRRRRVSERASERDENTDGGERSVCELKKNGILNKFIKSWLGAAVAAAAVAAASAAASSFVWRISCPRKFMSSLCVYVCVCVCVSVCVRLRDRANKRASQRASQPSLTCLYDRRSIRSPGRLAGRQAGKLAPGSLSVAVTAD